MEFLNGTSVPAVVLSIDGLGEHSNFPQGAKISGGAFPITEWKLKMRPKDSSKEDRAVEIDFRSKSGGSSTAVLLGDFFMEKGEGESKVKPRAKIVVLAAELNENNRRNRLIVLNGIPEKSISVSVSDTAPTEIGPMAESVWNGLPRHILAVANVSGQEFQLPVEFVGATTSAVIVFFLKDGKPSYIASAQTQMNSRIEP